MAAPLSGATADWLQFGYDQAHSGNNTAETILDADNVSGLATLYEIPLAVSVDSAPVFLSAVTTEDGSKDLLFVETRIGELLALDAGDGKIVWSRQPAIQGLAVTTSTPAIDPGRQVIYAYGLDGYVHKYQVGDGTEIVAGGWPQLITNKPNVEKCAAGLSIATVSAGATYLYVVTDGGISGDGGDYQGHVVTIDLASGAQTTFNAQCSNLPVHLVDDQSAAALGVSDCPQIKFPFPGNSGIWGRPGAVYDAATNRVFIATGNGLFDAKDTLLRAAFEPMTNGFNWADSVLALSADGTGVGQGPLDSYTPSNYQTLQGNDEDLGSTSPALLPAPAASRFAHLAVQGGKDANLRLLNLDDLSGNGAPGFISCNPGLSCPTSEIQTLAVPQAGQVKPQPAVWVDSRGDGATWTFVATGNGLSALKLVVDGTGKPSLSAQWPAVLAGNTTSPVIANDLLYAANGTRVIAVDPKTGTTLWTSVVINGGFHWQSMIVVNGRVYMPDNSAHLWAFALP
ncbi:MAG TPA: PQQ-binding-like beta-propeller repeat protein [Rudaea sp.]